MLKELTEDQGSVLMEFIVVMPIYFLLLGFAFVVGELSLHSIHLTASGDRNIAFTDAGTGYAIGPTNERTEAGFWRLLEQVLSFDRTALERRNVAATDYSYKGDLVYEGRATVSLFEESLDYHARKQALPTMRPGHWTEAVAGRAVDNYTLSPLTRGFVAHWFYEIERRVHDGDLMASKLDRAPRDDIDEILDKDKGSLGRVPMKANYCEDHTGKKIRDYGFSSLRRTENGRWWNKPGVGEKDDNSKMPYRYWSPAELAKDDAWKMAANDVKDGEQVATVALDQELYVRENSGGTELTKARKHTGGPDSSVDYKFSDVL